MDREKRKRKPETVLYFFLNNKLHKVLRKSRARDEMYAWCYPDKKRVLYSYAQVKKHMQKAYSVLEVAEILNRHKITIEEYILDGKIKKPQRIYPISNPESKWSKFMLNELDILDLHQFILDSGYIKDLPSKNELQALLKHNIILYTKTTDGNFIPVWKAE